MEISKYVRPDTLIWWELCKHEQIVFTQTIQQDIFK